MADQLGARSLRLGIWAPVHGSRAALQDPEEPYDASFARSRRLVLEAEALGFDSVLVAQHTVDPRDPGLDQLEAWTAAAALAALTSRIEIIAAIKPMLYHPVVLAAVHAAVPAVRAGDAALRQRRRAAPARGGPGGAARTGAGRSPGPA